MMIAKEYSSGPEDLLLVGTLHLDPEGFEKSVALFESHQPDLVLVELSPYGCRFRHNYRRKLRKTLKLNLKKAAKSCGISFSHARNHGEIKRIWSQLALPFEYRAAVDYGRKRNVTVALVDSSSFSQEWISCWTELISTDNLKILLSLSPQPPSVHQLYQLAKRRIEGQMSSGSFDPSVTDPAETPMWEERERYMAERIKEAAKTCSAARAVFIGGWWHLTKGGKIPTLRELLGIDASHCSLV